jgi:hypothetical protein
MPRLRHRAELSASSSPAGAFAIACQEQPATGVAECRNARVAIAGARIRAVVGSASTRQLLESAPRRELAPLAFARVGPQPVGEVVARSRLGSFTVLFAAGADARLKEDITEARALTEAP